MVDVINGNGLERQIDVLGAAPSEINPRIIEVYPGGTLTSFLDHCESLVIDKYKGDRDARMSLLVSISQWFSLDLSKQNLDSIVGEGKKSDKVDSIIAAITALLYATSVLQITVGEAASSVLTEWRVRCPRSTEEKDSAEEEGWIFFPIQSEVATGG